MSNRIALHPSVVCLGFGGCAGFIYLFVGQIIVNIDYHNYHKTGSGTDFQEWMYALSDFLVVFPFRSLVYNSLAWTLAGIVLCALLIWRKRRMAKVAK